MNYNIILVKVCPVDLSYAPDGIWHQYSADILAH